MRVLHLHCNTLLAPIHHCRELEPLVTFVLFVFLDVVLDWQVVLWAFLKLNQRRHQQLFLILFISSVFINMRRNWTFENLVRLEGRAK